MTVLHSISLTRKEWETIVSLIGEDLNWIGVTGVDPEPYDCAEKLIKAVNSLPPDSPMTQHRVYFTAINSGYINCDSEEHAKQVQQELDDGLPLDEVCGYIRHTSGEREHNYKVVE